jgi:threonine/homoserine/homoserine lactone efflux protein
MDGTLFGTHDFFTFLLAAIALNLVPGQDTLYILGRSLAQGRTAGIVSVFGIGSGCLVHISAAALGLYALLALWPVAFTIISLLGALYLVWLGISIWMRRNVALTPFAYGKKPESLLRIFRQGFFTNLLNPKVALFFLAFLPQFIDHSSGYGPLSFLFLGFTFFCTGTIWCLIIATGASSFSNTLRGDPKIQWGFDLFASLLFIGLGVGILVTSV